MSARARAVGEGTGVLLEGNQEGIRRCDLEGGGGGVGVTRGRVMGWELQKGLEQKTKS